MVLRDEISKIEKYEEDLSELEQKYQDELEQIKKDNLKSLEEYAKDVQRFDLTFLAEEMKLKNFEEKQNELLSECLNVEENANSYNKKWKELLIKIGECFGIDIKKEYPHIFEN